MRPGISFSDSMMSLRLQRKKKKKKKKKEEGEEGPQVSGPEQKQGSGWHERAFSRLWCRGMATVAQDTADRVVRRFLPRGGMP